MLFAVPALERAVVDSMIAALNTQATASDSHHANASWLLTDGLGTFFAGGYVGQYILLVPPLDLIIVRNGNTPVERRPHVMALLRRIIDLFRAA